MGYRHASNYHTGQLQLSWTVFNKDGGRWHSYSGPPFLEQDHFYQVHMATWGQKKCPPNVQKSQPAAQSWVPSWSFCVWFFAIANPECTSQGRTQFHQIALKAIIYKVYSGTWHHLLGAKNHTGTQNLIFCSCACPEIFIQSVLSLNFVSVFMCVYGIYNIYGCVCVRTCVNISVSVEEPCHSMGVEVRGQPQMSFLSFCPSLLLFTAAYTRLASPDNLPRIPRW